MRTTPIFQCSIPVFRHYLSRLDDILKTLPEARGELLRERLAPDMMTAGENFRTAQGFVLRTVFPLAGRKVPDLATEQCARDDLLARSGEIRTLLAGLDTALFDDAAARIITHIAGRAELHQDGASFLTLYALPNFFFHLSIGYAVLRHHGVAIGKSNFDGHHLYG